VFFSPLCTTIDLAAQPDNEADCAALRLESRYLGQEPGVGSRRGAHQPIVLLHNQIIAWVLKVALLAKEK